MINRTKYQWPNCKWLKGVAFGLAILLVNTATAGTFYVRSTGSDSNNGRNRNQAFRTIAKAVSECEKNDTIYVGAGTYSERFYKNYGTDGGDLRIYGDNTGRFTGDKGDVIIDLPTNRWSFYIHSARNVMISNVKFVGKSEKNWNGYACYFPYLKGYSYLINCEFENTRYSVYSYDSRYNYLWNCSFKNVLFGAYFNKSQFGIAYNCNFEDARYGLYMVDIGTAYAYGCKFKGEVDKNGRTATNYPIMAYRSGVYVWNSTFDKPNYGLYGRDLKYMYFVNSQINEPANYGVYATGTRLLATNVTVKGDGNRRGYGMALGDTSGKASTLSRVNLTGLYAGILTIEGELNFQQVKSTGNYMGIYYYYRTPTLTLDKGQRIDLTDNTFGIYARHLPNRDYPGQLTVRDQKITDCDYGVYAYETDVRLTNCEFTKNGRAAQLFQSKRVIVNKCKFTDNVARNNGWHCGLYVRSERARLTNIEASNSGYGVLYHSIGDREPTLRNLTLTDNKNANLWLHKGNWTWTDRNRIKISGGRFGLYANATNVKISKATMPTNCDYPIYNYKGELAMHGCKISDGSIGIYAIYSPNVVIDNTVTENQKSYGMFLHTVDKASLTNNQALKNRSIGIYAYRTGDLTIAKCTSNENGHGFYLNSPRKSLLTDSEATSNRSHGLYHYQPKDAKFEYQVRNSSFAKNTYGYRTVGVPFDKNHVRNLKVVDNNHGVRIERQPLILRPEMNIVSTGNRYGFMAYYGELDVDEMAIKDNYVGLYSWQSPMKATNSEITATGYGIINYTGNSEVENLDISGASYGIYFSARDANGDDMRIKNTRIKNNKHIAIYARGYRQDSEVIVSDSLMQGGNYGLYGYLADLNASNTDILDTRYYGITHNGGNADFADVEIKSNHWGVVSYGQSKAFKMVRSKVSSKYGVYLRVLDAKLVNTVIQDSYYGVYTNHPDGNFDILQSTIGNIKYYGILHRYGKATVRNSIVDADLYAMYKYGNTGTLEHDHNLVHGDRKAFINTLPDETEIEKQPIFLDPKVGDLHLAEGSPAINAGMDLTSISAIDIEGNARPSFRQFELGAYEYTKADGSLRILDWEEKAK